MKTQLSENHAMETTGFRPNIFSRLLLCISRIIRVVIHYPVEFVQDWVTMGITSTKCLSTVRLDGKTAVITGCNTGIGKETTKDFFLRGAKVIMACRNVQAANETMELIKKECASCENCGEIKVTELDLASLESVRTCAKHIMDTENKINLLINNAGIMMCPHLITKDGFEMQIGTNHLGHFLLTLLLLPKIIDSKPARIVNVSSMAHSRGKIKFSDLNWEKRTYSSLGAYEQSKLANVLFTQELARRLADNNIHGVTTYSLHPGVIATELGRHLDTIIPGLKWTWEHIGRRFIKTPEQGAQTTIYCAVDEKCANETGLYYSECREKSLTDRAKDEDTARKLWDVSCELVKLESRYDLPRKSN